MKKIIFFMLLIMSLTLVSCKQSNEEDKFNHDQDLDRENMFFDDFTNGIDKKSWVIGNTKWGINNGGVIYENVGYTEDGVVVLTSNGDFYDGPLKGIGNADGKRTGSMIKTREALGPGRYEVRMKIMPRFGSTTAMWTYYYNNEMNHEIDIELNVENDFHVMMTTNWHTIKQFSTKKNYTDVVLNDFEWHTFRFDWRTNPQRIDYFLDDKLISTQESYVPDHAGEFNIGNWFPDAWAGVPNFETDYTYVDWFKYTPFKNNEYVQTPSNEASPDFYYPTEPMEYPVANLISNAGFETKAEAWRFDANSGVEILEESGIGNSRSILIPKDNIAYQMITGLDETFEMRLIANAKLPKNGSGYILLEFHGNEIGKIDQTMLRFSDKDENYLENKFYKKEVVFQVPAGTKQVEFSLIGESSEIYFDDIFFNLSKKQVPGEEMIDKPLDFDFYDSFDNGIDSNLWNIQNRRWGGSHHGGVVAKNVNYTEDGYLILQANGDYYEGDIKDVDGRVGKRTGATITTKQYFSPGSFEVRAKAMPRFGATTAFWTYNYQNGINSEIDIELNVRNDFHATWFTNWLTETDYISEKTTIPVLHNDGKFHKYRFDWYTSPTPRVDYYIDDVLYHTATTKVPRLEAQFNIGVWFPNNWAGNPDFETDYMIVDYFSYKKFENQPFDKTTNGSGNTSSVLYPKAPIKLPSPNLISNGNLNSDLGFDLRDGATINNKELIINKGSASQYISSVDDKQKLLLEFESMGTNSYVRLNYYDLNNNFIGTKDYLFSGSENSYGKFTKELELIKKTKRIDIIFGGNNSKFRNLYLNIKEG